MMKRLLAALLCIIMMLGLISCGKGKGDEEEAVDQGAYINLYLSDIVYDFDPAHAFYNDSALKVVSLLFDTLFTLDTNGKVKKNLVKEYEIKEDEKTQEYKLLLTLNDTCWSDGSTKLSANDVVFSIKRILDVEASSEFAPLLFDIKNARAAKNGDVSIDAVGVYAVDRLVVEFSFEERIDYDAFIRTLCSPALAPLPETIVSKGEDWAKKPTTMMTSGPFKIRKVSYEEGKEELVLERNEVYYRDKKKDDPDVSVRPYKLIVDYTLTDEQIKEKYEAGDIFYVGDIPMSLREEYKSEATITDAISTATLFFQTQQLKVPMTYEEELESREEQSRLEEESKLIAEGKVTTGDSEAPTEPGTKAPSKPLTPAEQLIANQRKELIKVYEAINKNAVLFSDADVRKALSLAIDRNAIAEAVVFAKPATGLVPYPVTEDYDAKKSFRVNGKTVTGLKSSADIDAAKALLAKYNTADYTIALTVAAYDEVHMAIAEIIKASWEALGFAVEINALGVIPNDDYYKYTDSTPTDICDDLYAEALRSGVYQVILQDYTAYSSSAYSMLAPFAYGFSGQGIDMSGNDYTIPTHVTGYKNDKLTAAIENYLQAATAEEKSQYLHEAEEILIGEDMGVIPVIFNQNATLTRKDLKKLTASFYCPAHFTKAKLKNYEDYLPDETEFVVPDETHNPNAPGNNQPGDDEDEE